MLKIFDKNHNAIGHIVKYKDCEIESELYTGDKTLFFTYLASHHNLTNEMYVRTKDDEFVIKEVPGTTGSFPQIVAVLNLEDLQKDMWQTFSVTDVTIDEAVRTVLAGTGWTIGECNVAKRRNAGMMHVSSLDVIHNLCNAFMCEPVFDTINKKVSFYVQRGEDKGVYFMSGLNLKKLQKKSTSYDYYTRIIPIGANGLTIESVNDGKNYLENYQYSNKELTYIWKDESYTDAQALKDDAELKLNDLSKPTLSYSADVRDLAKQKTEYAILSYGIGDNVTLIDRETGTRDKQRIVKLVEYPQNPEKNTCELANTVLTFEEMQQKVQDAANIINFTVAGDGRYTGTINVSDILHFEQGVAGSTTVSGINSSISTMQGDIAQVKMTVGEIDANYIKAEEANLKYATIENLNVTNETVHSIQGDYASFKSTVTDEFAAQSAIIDNLSGRYATFEQTVTDELITAKGWMLEGSIGSAQISSVDANKIKSGTIDTALVNIVGSDGRLQISDNTIQISDANRVRVQAGKDASGDYTLAVWDSAGNLIWDALGATENTIQRKIIRDKMVADDAAIQALKLDLQSFNTALTDQGVTISGTVVQVGNKTLNVALTEQTQLLTDHGEKLTDHATRIAANENAISLRVTTQEYESNKTTVNNEIASAKNRLTTAESSITMLNGKIALKVEQTDIDTAVNNLQVGDRNLILNSKPNETSSTYGFAFRNTVKLTAGQTYIFMANGRLIDGNGTLTVYIYNDNWSSSTNMQTISKTDVTMQCAFTPKTSGVYRVASYSFLSQGTAGGNVHINWYKLVKGTKATTDWTPAPEDVESSISAAHTIAEQTATKFSWLVKSGTSSTDFTLTDRTASLVADYINLNGKVTFSGLDSSAQSKINTAQSTADTAVTNAATAQSTANTANSTANSVKSTVDAGKSNWDSAYSWTSANGSNMTSLLSMVKKWTGNAVSDATTINGGWISTNTITANKLAIGDFTNYCTVNPNYPDTMLPSSFAHGGTKVTGTSDTGNYVIRKANESQEYLMLCDYTPMCFNVGDELYFYGNLPNYSSTGCSARVSIWLYNSNKGWIRNYDFWSGTLKAQTWNKVSGSVKIANVTDARYFLIGISTGTNSHYIGACDLICRKKSSGALIVDGTITTNKLAANSITTAKLATDAIKSTNYAYSSGNFSTAGTFLDLSTGIIRSKNFAIDSSGNAYLNGTIEATSGKIGNFTLSTSSIYATYSNGLTFYAGGTDYPLAIKSGTTLSGFYVDSDGKLTSSTATIKVGMNSMVLSPSGTSVDYLTKNIKGYLFNENYYIRGTKSSSNEFYVTTSSEMYVNSAKVNSFVACNAFTPVIDSASASTYAIQLASDKTTFNNYAVSFEVGTTFNGYMLCSLPFSAAAITNGTPMVFSSNGYMRKGSSSSKRYKNHVRNMTDADVSKLYDLSPVWFTYKDGYLDKDDINVGKPIPGFYAEDVLECFPNAVRYNASGQVEDWDYKTMIPAMMMMVQSQRKEWIAAVDTVKDDVACLRAKTESEVDSLKSQVLSLRYQLEQAYMRIATLEKQQQAAG